MIIDLILDREAGDAYDPKSFYDEVMDYGEIWPDIAHPIARAMDTGDNEAVQDALCTYIHEEGYNPEICDYIRKEDWV